MDDSTCHQSSGMKEMKDDFSPIVAPSTPIQAAPPPAEDTVMLETSESNTTSASTGKPKRLTPDSATLQLHARYRWQALLPTLIDDYLCYITASHGKIIHPVDSILVSCTSGTSESDIGKTSRCKISKTKSTAILCLCFDHFRHISVTTCDCQSLQQVLVQHGLFPTAPSQTRIAVSIDLLLFYGALFERSCDAVNALALALNSFYSRRGFELLNKISGEKIKEPFRKSLGYASQWLDVLRLKIEERTTAAMLEADKKAKASSYFAELTPSTTSWATGTTTSPETSSSTAPLAPKKPKKSKKRKRAQSPSHIASAANPPEEQLSDSTNSARKGSTLPPGASDKSNNHPLTPTCTAPLGRARLFSFAPIFTTVTQPKLHIKSVRKAPPRRNATSRSNVPNQALDECERSYEAATGDKKKAVEFRMNSPSQICESIRPKLPNPQLRSPIHT
ncbi:hypothetical protein CVT24_010769 [Panaeolus cyanescens]|uniref:CxC1-like cysteine cluster associated with KDZ transposases domain-containing protein n=1 Tax=Panaeolus cyanescens TaxID=181874 RepID=A0A409YMC0_9AGAR|nr:hypothetical protein CVT24_010769 [Panaeolus cyanescens]